MFRTSSRTPLVSALCAAALVGGGLTLAASAPATASASPAEPPHYNAEQVHHFLQGFYGNHGPRQWERDHLVAEPLKKRAAKNKHVDLLLCAQGNPRDIAVGRVTTAQSAAVGWARVTTRWAGGRTKHFTAYVGLDAAKPIKLSQVECGGKPHKQAPKPGHHKDAPKPHKDAPKKTQKPAPQASKQAPKKVPDRG